MTVCNGTGTPSSKQRMSQTRKDLRVGGVGHSHPCIGLNIFYVHFRRAQGSSPLRVARHPPGVFISLLKGVHILVNVGIYTFFLIPSTLVGGFKPSHITITLPPPTPQDNLRTHEDALRELLSSVVAFLARWQVSPSSPPPPGQSPLHTQGE